MNQLPQTNDALLRLPQVLELIPVSKSGFWQGVKEGRYPQPLRISPRVTVWSRSSIMAYIASVAAGAK